MNLSRNERIGVAVTVVAILGFCSFFMVQTVRSTPIGHEKSAREAYCKYLVDLEIKISHYTIHRVDKEECIVVSGTSKVYTIDLDNFDPKDKEED